MQGTDLEYFDSQGCDDWTRILVHDLLCRTRELNAVSVHDKGDRGPVETCGSKAVQSLAGDPARIATMTNNQTFGSLASFQSEGKTRCNPYGHAEPAGADGSASGHPGHVARDVETSPEAVDDAIFGKEPQRCEGGVVADARMPVLNGVLALLVIG